MDPDLRSPEALGVPELPPPPGVPDQPPLWQEAYVEYLKSITLIAQALQEEAAGTGKAGPLVPPRGTMGSVEVLQCPQHPLPTENSEGVTPDTPKLLKLAEQCLERVKSIAAALGE